MTRADVSPGAGVFMRFLAMRSALQLALLLTLGAGVIGVTLAWFFYAPMPPETALPDGSRSVETAGRTRSFTVWAPPLVQPNAPLLLVLHGSMMNGVQMRQMLGPRFERLAQQHGAIVVYPSGVEGHFNDGRLAATYSARTLNIDDVGFVRAIIDTLAAEHHINRQRVYAFGYSNGGQMAMRLATEAPDLIAGVIVSNANVPTDDNRGWTLASAPAAASAAGLAASRSPRVVLLEGTLDPINPYTGGLVTIFGFGNRGTVLSSLDSARWFAQRAGVDGPPTSDTRRTLGALTVQQQDWGTPAQVRLVTLHGAGHTVAQSDYRFPRFLGATAADDTLLNAAWDLIDRR